MSPSSSTTSLRLQHPADLDAFFSLAAAHADVSNRSPTYSPPSRSPWSSARPCITVTATRTTSSPSAPSSTHVDLFWTGRAICAPAITAVEAVTFARSALRPPLYWDNYPVNDVAMIHEAHLGPYRRRDPLLDRFSVGVMANAMEHPEASKIALATIADYLWAPAEYDPERSWQRAVAEAGGPDSGRGSASPTPSAAAASPNQTRSTSGASSSISSSPSPTATRQRPGRASATRRPARQRRGDAALAGRLQPAAAGELQPWLDKFAIGADAVSALALVAGAGTIRGPPPSCAGWPAS